MSVRICFYSYFKDLTGCSVTAESVVEGSTLGELVKQLAVRFPKLGALEKSMLMTVGVEYQRPSYVLRAGDEVSLFPPVQGG